MITNIQWLNKRNGIYQDINNGDLFITINNKTIKSSATAKKSNMKTSVDSLILYRGAPSSDNPFKLNKYTNKLGISFTTDPAYALNFSTMTNNEKDYPTVKRYRIKTTAKVMFLSKSHAQLFDDATLDLTDEIEKQEGRGLDTFEVPNLKIEFAKKNKYDVIDMRKAYKGEQEIRVLNPNVLELI